MPTPELMTWVPAQKRWTKRYLGKRYYVSARKLGCPETKEASLQAANSWWRDKQAELDYAYRAKVPELRHKLPMEDVAEAALVTTDLATMIRDTISTIATQNPFTSAEQTQPPPIDGATLENIIASEVRRVVGEIVRGAVLSGEPLPEGIRSNLPPARAHQLEKAVKEMRGESATDPERTVQAAVDAWTEKQRLTASIGGMTAARFALLTHQLRFFAAFLGESADVGVIDAERLEGFHYFCLSKIADKRQDDKDGWSQEYASDVFSVARRFVRWLAERGTIPAPANLISKGFRFGSTAKRIQTWTPEEVRHVIGSANGTLKLSLLLMANCGFTQQDISDLRSDEVNWREGRIIRKRSKTGDRDSTPTVDYAIWPLTFALLKKHRSHGERAVLTRTGEPFIRKELRNGKLRAKDVLSSNFNRFRKTIGFTKPMKQLRKTSASLLETHEVYGRFTSLFLGHAPASMKDRHYAAPPQELFDSAIAWLGEQLGIDRIEA